MEMKIRLLKKTFGEDGTRHEERAILYFELDGFGPFRRPKLVQVETFSGTICEYVCEATGELAEFDVNSETTKYACFSQPTWSSHTKKWDKKTQTESSTFDEKPEGWHPLNELKLDWSSMETLYCAELCHVTMRAIVAGDAPVSPDFDDAPGALAPTRRFAEAKAPGL